MAASKTPQTIRRAGAAAGAGILLITALAVFANFGVLERLVVEGDANETARRITASEGLFRWGIASLFLVAALDVAVAWALRVFFAPVHQNMSMLAAWFRLVYAVVLLVATSQLPGVLPLVDGATTFGPYPADPAPVQALSRIDTFHDLWNAGLILFGIHLLLLGWLAFTSGYVPRALGVLIALAGLGYLVDSFGALASSSYALDVAVFTFVGEFLLMLWLLAIGRSAAFSKEPPPARGRSRQELSGQ
uniref:DUF4386 domain-containing protein n=1 Tax=Streptomyces sp. NBC_00003 TaxID=2903608 RepID=A0AAU2UXX9_9ACTN